jgi:hypothetical protein
VGSDAAIREAIARGAIERKRVALHSPRLCGTRMLKRAQVRQNCRISSAAGGRWRSWSLGGACCRRKAAHGKLPGSIANFCKARYFASGVPRSARLGGGPRGVGDRPIPVAMIEASSAIIGKCCEAQDFVRRLPSRRDLGPRSAKPGRKLVTSNYCS